MRTDHEMNTYLSSYQIIVYRSSWKDCLSECWPQGSLFPNALSLIGINVTFNHVLCIDVKRKLIKNNFQAFRIKVPSMAWELLAGLEWFQLCAGSGQWSCTHINSVVNGQIIESQFMGSIFFCPEESSLCRC